MLLSRLLFHMFQSFSCVNALFTKWSPVVIFSSFWSQPVEKNVLVCMCTPTFWFIDLWDTGPSPRAFEPARLKTRPYSWLDQHISTCKGCTLRLVVSAFSGTQDGRSSVNCSVQFSCSVMSDSLQLHELQNDKASLSITNSQNLLRLMSIASVKPSNHLILCCSLLLSPSIFPSIRVFSNESVLRMR